MDMGSSSNEMEKGGRLGSEFLQDFSSAAEGAGEFWPFSDAEIIDGITKGEQEKPGMPMDKHIESTGGWLQWLSDGLNQANSERAMESAHEEYAAYRESQNIALVDEAFKHYMEASRGTRHREWRLLCGCTFAALVCYRRDGKSQQDLTRLIRIGDEIMASWTNTMEQPDFAIRMVYLIARANKDFYLQSIKKEGVEKSHDNEEAFTRAQKCYTRVIDNDQVGNLSRVAHIELGTLIVRRCRHKKVVQGLDIAIAHLKHTLNEANQPERTPLTDTDKLCITGNLTLAHYTLYIYQARNLFTYPFTQTKRLQNVDSALDYLERTQIQLEHMKSTKVGPTKFQFMLATLLFFRWLETKKQSDAEQVETALETGRAMEGVNEEQKLVIDRLLARVKIVRN